MVLTSILSVLTAAVIIAVVWLYRVNSAMRAVPRGSLQHSPHRLTEHEIHATYERLSKAPLNFTKLLPPRLDRRYIVVGGSGLVGGDIVLQLLQRGQSPQSIRIVDFAPLIREEMLEKAGECDFVKADITSPASVEAAFSKPWPASVAESPLTVFHTAAAIRPSERSPVFYERVRRVNVDGTAIVMAAARAAGADIFIATSSASIAVTPVSFWAPWRSEPKDCYQVITEADFDAPMRPHNRYFANYAISKAVAERLVCGANEDKFRTGCIRPGNGIYGDKRDLCVGLGLMQGDVMSWVPQNIQNFVSARNISLAHLQFEAALTRKPMPRCAGRPFLITDPGPPISFADYYNLCSLLSATYFMVAYPPPVLMLMLAHAIETYCLTLAYLPFLKTVFGLKEPAGLIENMQPSIFTVCSATIAVDAAARASVEDGGLGYRGGCTTPEGM
ncbi:hypothetical protein B0T22DRAFT_352943, partial [Podospora appendiculata]